MTNMEPTLLATTNPHPRDACITFDEGPHIYTINGDSGFTSVTTWNHSHFREFDADAIITKMMSGPNWSNSKYFGMTREQIKKAWDDNRDEAAQAGTKMHYDIECFYNGMEVDNDSIEYSFFKAFRKDNPDLKPYRTEWMVWDAELRLAGSIDMVYEKPNGHLMIYDWKRSKGIVRNKRFEEYSTTECISHLPDTNYWHYSLQLNMYRSILQRHYGKVVDELRLVCLHPCQRNYIVFDVPHLDEEIGDLLQLRKQQLI